MTSMNVRHGRLEAPAELSPWYSDADRFHHTNAECVHADGVDRGRQRGSGGKPICALCDRVNRIDLELDGPWFPPAF